MKTMKLIRSRKYQNPKLPVTIVFEDRMCKDYYIKTIYSRTIGTKSKNIIVLKGGNMTITTFSNYDQLCHQWTLPEAKYGKVSSHRMHFDGNIMYSYNAPIAKKYQSKGILVINREYCGYSVSTSNHIWAVKSAFNHWTIIYDFGVSKNLRQTLQNLKKFLVHFRRKRNFVKKFDAPACQDDRTLFKGVLKDYKTLSEFLVCDLMSEEEHKYVDLISDNIEKYEQHKDEIYKKRREQQWYNLREDEENKHKILLEIVEYCTNRVKFDFKEHNIDVESLSMNEAYELVKEWVHEHDKSIIEDCEIPEKYQGRYSRERIIEYVMCNLLNIDLSDYKNEIYHWTNQYAGEPWKNQDHGETREGYPRWLSGIGDYMKLLQDGSIKTNRYATVSTDCVSNIFLMAIYYLNDQYSLERKYKKLIGKHCGAFVIREVTDHYVAVGCHTFLKPIIAQFVKDYSKYLKELEVK